MSRADGELWIPPTFCVSMSTIIVTYRTAEGFVIASDGRNSNPETGEIHSDEAQKIFPIERLNAHLALALAGTIRLGENAGNVVFDFESAAKSTARELADIRLKDWWSYVSEFAAEIDGPLSAARTRCNAALNKSTDTRIFIGGFWGDKIKSADIHFAHGITITETEPRLHPPEFDVPFGSGRVFEFIEREDARFARYSRPKRGDIRSLSAAIDRAKNDVLAHCDPEALKIDEETCRGIGGRVQIATVTFSEGFRWVPGFEPTARIPAQEKKPGP
jgi:hypothetical protein